MLISETYRDLSAQLHAMHWDYGTYGSRYAKRVRGILARIGGGTVLDYGAGKQTLEQMLCPKGFVRGHRGVGFVTSYDPAIPNIARRPLPVCDVVVCTDVLEHVESECLGDVLDEIAGLAGKVVLLDAATRPSTKTLADGRNAHITLRLADWWRATIARHFHDFTVVATDDHEGRSCDFELERT